MTVLPAVFLALGAAALTSCTQTGGLKLSPAPVEVPAEKALAFPPPGGPAIVSVIEQNYANAVKQDIALGTDATTRGQNYIQVRYFGPASQPFAGASRLSMRPMTTGDAVREMRSEFPTIRMSISPSYVQNNYGAFAYAFGISPTLGEACLYGWQQIKAPDNYVRTFRYLGMIQTRVRICQTGASRESLLSTMYHYTLTGAFDSVGWNPYGPVPDLDPTVGQLGRPIYAAGAGSALVVQGPAVSVSPRSVARQTPRAVRRAAAPAPALVQPTRASVPAVSIPAPTMISRPSMAGGPSLAGGTQAARPVIPAVPCATPGTACAGGM